MDSLLSLLFSTPVALNFKPWPLNFKYQSVSTIAFISVCDFSIGSTLKQSMYGTNTCGKACTLLTEAFNNNKPQGFEGYSVSDHVHYVALTNGDRVTIDYGSSIETSNVFFSFRGTYIWDLVNKRRGKNSALTVASLCEGCAISGGALKSFISLRASILSRLLKAEKVLTVQNAEPVVTTIGMSLGSSFAAMAGIYMRAQASKNVKQVYTFGSPRYSNNVFKKYFTGLIDHAVFALYRDPVPHYPPRLFGFRHAVSKLYLLYIDPMFFAVEARGEEPEYLNYLHFRQYDDDIKFSGAVNFFDVHDHQLYFMGLQEQAIASCGGMSDLFMKNVEGTSLFL